MCNLFKTGLIISMAGMGLLIVALMMVHNPNPLFAFTSAIWLIVAIAAFGCLAWLYIWVKNNYG